MKEIWDDSPVLAVLIITVVLFIVFFLVDIIGTTPMYFHGVVVDKHYNMERRATGTGIVSTSNGGTAVVVTTETEPEKFIVMVRTAGGKVYTVECPPEVYYAKKEGQTIECYWSRGLITGMSWGVYGIR